jgi:acyl-CoA thioester hydrolase
MTPPVSPPDLDSYPFWTDEKTRNADTDRQGHVNNAVIATFFEAGRIEVLTDPRIQQSPVTTSIVVARLLIDYRKELFFPGSVRIGSRVSRVGRTSFQFEQTLQSSGGEVAHAQATCVLIDAATHQPTPVPDALRRFLLDPPPAALAALAALPTAQ